MEEVQLKLSESGRLGQKQCHNCRKTFAERRWYRDHLKYDFSCWKVRKQEEKRSQVRTSKKEDERKDSEYGYESDSGRGTSSDSSCYNDEDRQFEDPVVKENLLSNKTLQNQVVKRRSTDMLDSTNCMVRKKSEVSVNQQSWIKRQEETGISSNSLINDEKKEDIKPIVCSQIPSTGIRMLIDKNDMSVVMSSEHLEDKEVFADACLDEEIRYVKPVVGELGQNGQARIKITLTKGTSDQNNYVVTMASEVVTASIFDTKFILCSNNECPKVGNHVCAFPAFRETGGYYKTKGVISIKKSLKTGKPKFVPFNLTFLKTLGYSFNFKAYDSHMEIRGRSTNTKNIERFKITLYENNFQSSTLGTLGSFKYKASSSIPTNNFEGNFIKYKLIIEKQPLSCHLYTG